MKDIIRTAYRGFIIEKDLTLDTDIYYIRRADGGKWSVCALDHPTVSIESIEGTIEDAKAYINSIEDYYEAYQPVLERR